MKIIVYYFIMLKLVVFALLSLSLRAEEETANNDNISSFSSNQNLKDFMD